MKLRFFFSILVFQWLFSFAASADLPKPDVIVVGAGPAGLFSAVQILEAGHSVTVMEKRIPAPRQGEGVAAATRYNYWATRLRLVGLDQETYDYLRSLGMDEASGLIPFAGQEFIDADREQISMAGLFRFITGRGFGGVASIHQIEIFLKRRLEQLGGKIIYGTDVDSSNLSSLQARQLIVWAAGKPPLQANSRGSAIEARGARWLVANFEYSDINSEGKYLVELPSAKHDGTTVLIPGKGMATIYVTSLTDDKGLRDSDLINAARRVGISGRLVGEVDSFQVSEGNLGTYSVRLDQGTHLLIVGDSARKIDPLTGLGVTNAYHDSKLIGEFVAYSESTQLSNALGRFELGMRQRSAYAHNQSELFNKLKTGIKVFGKVSNTMPAPLRHITRVGARFCELLLSGVRR